MAFLHGIEHIDLPSDFSPVNDIVTAVIGLIGVAEKGPINELTLCSNVQDDAQFGEEGTIPLALKAIRAQDSKRGSALVLVVSVGKDFDKVEAKNIIGEVKDGYSTGLKLFETANSLFGFEPMIYIAPIFDDLEEVITELVSITNKTEAMAYIDAIGYMSCEELLAARKDPAGYGNLNEGQKLLYPYISTSLVEGDFLCLSPFAAGLRAKVDLEEGWHVSSSNHAYNGITGTIYPLTFAMGDQTCQVNMLNAQGITTIVNLSGRGMVEWGNYTAGYPGNMDSEAFECVRRTRAIMKRAIQQACIPFIDKPFIQANVDAIRNTVNQYLNSLKAQNKIVDGQCYYRPENNPLNNLAQGHITFDIEFTPALPMQRITFTYKIDLATLSSIQ